MDNVLERLTTVALLRSAEEWREASDVWDLRAVNSFHADEIRYANETRKLIDAVARWRQVYDEVTA